MEEMKAFYREANACVKTDAELSNSFAIGIRVRQRYVMLPWLFNIFMDGCMREMKPKVGRIGAKMKLNRGDLSVSACLFADDIVLLAKNERELQRVVDPLHSVCSRRKLRVNAGKSKVMVFERKEVEVVNFGNPYLSRPPCHTPQGPPACCIGDRNLLHFWCIRRLIFPSPGLLFTLILLSLCIIYFLVGFTSPFSASKI